MSSYRKLCLLAIAVALECVVVISPVCALPVAQSGSQVHVVAPGETLWGIALKYGVSLGSLLAANHLEDPNQIAIGQELFIPTGATLPQTGQGAQPESSPTPGFSQVHVVALGESLSGIAARYRTTVAELVKANGLADPNLLSAGQRLLVPAGEGSAAQINFGTEGLPAPFAAVELRPERPKQGDTVLVTVETAQEAKLSGRFEGQGIMFLDDGRHHWGLVPIHPMADLGPHNLIITAAGADGKAKDVVGQVWVEAGVFEVEDITLPPDRQKLLDRKLIVAENERLALALGMTDVKPLWRGLFQFPLTDPVKTSEYGTRRSYNGGRPSGYHEGLDLDATGGEPVMAAADGRVVMAEPLTVRGNAIMIDHGMNVHTGYWHLSEIDVKMDQEVKAGDVIGKAGGTGLATGPHLHWEVRVGDVNVNPEQWIKQAFP